MEKSVTKFEVLFFLSGIAIVRAVEKQPEVRMPQISSLNQRNSDGLPARNSYIDMIYLKREDSLRASAVSADRLYLMRLAAVMQSLFQQDLSMRIQIFVLRRTFFGIAAHRGTWKPESYHVTENMPPRARNDHHSDKAYLHHFCEPCERIHTGPAMANTTLVIREKRVLSQESYLTAMGDPHGKRSVLPEVLFESASSLVLSKPAGIPVIPGRSPQDVYSLRQWAEQRYPDSRIYVVHRIDKLVSGVVLFARTPEAHRAYCMAFEHGMVDKRYLALVEGVGCQDEGEIAITLTQSVRPQYVIPAPVTKKGRIHRTTYRVLERFRNFTLIELALWTGFRHQIRVHLKAIGYPLAVDPLYGRRSSLKLSDIKGGKRYRGKQLPESPIIDRVSLHALSIEFEEHQTGKIHRIEAPLPRDLAYLLKALRKYDT